MLIDAKVLTESRAWSVSKINRLSPNGLLRVTLAEGKYDEHKDYIELDDNGNVVAMWADYYSNGRISPIDPTDSPTTIYSTITYSGIKPEIKIGGSYKKFTVTFYNETEPINFRTGNWSFEIDGQDASGLLSQENSPDINENQIKIKFVEDTSYIGKVLVVKYTSVDGISSSVEINLVGL